MRSTSGEDESAFARAGRVEAMDSWSMIAHDAARTSEEKIMRVVHLLPAILGAGLFFAAPAHAQATRNYDCSKAGNANKAVCKQAAAKPAAPAAPATMAARTRTYNCALAGNANRAACKTAPAAAAAAAPPAPAARATAVSHSTSSHTVSTTTTSNAGGPNGATAICNDGTYSHSAHHSGSCSHHGGVKQFY